MPMLYTCICIYTQTEFYLFVCGRPFESWRATYESFSLFSHSFIHGTEKHASPYTLSLFNFSLFLISLFIRIYKLFRIIIHKWQSQRVRQ